MDVLDKCQAYEGFVQSKVFKKFLSQLIAPMESLEMAVPTTENLPTIEKFESLLLDISDNSVILKMVMTHSDYLVKLLVIIFGSDYAHEMKRGSTDIDSISRKNLYKVVDCQHPEHMLMIKLAKFLDDDSNDVESVIKASKIDAKVLRAHLLAYVAAPLDLPPDVIDDLKKLCKSNEERCFYLKQLKARFIFEKLYNSVKH